MGNFLFSAVSGPSELNAFEVVNRSVLQTFEMYGWYIDLYALWVMDTRDR